MGREVFAARGAICIARDESSLVEEATRKLVDSLASRNGISAADCVFLLFSVTSDIRSRNPATAAREAGWDVPLFCVREAEFEGSPRLVLRLLLAFSAETGTVPAHAYLDGAEKLRPDLFADEQFQPNIK